MINEIIEAVSIALNAEFGEGYSIYAEEAPQNLETPCFFISCINTKTDPYPSGRYKRQNQFAIQYFPESVENPRLECLDIAERILWLLEVVSVKGGTSIRGTDMHYEVEDNILHYFVNYDFFVRKRKEYDLMESMEQSFWQKG